MSNKSKEFDINWETPSGFFGWSKVPAQDVEEAMEFFYTLRGKRVPHDAEINVARQTEQQEDN